LPIPEALHVLLGTHGLLMKVELHLGEQVMPLSDAARGSFLSISASAIEEIDPPSGMCLLSLKFRLRK
jgi:hypothetical protein